MIGPAAQRAGQNWERSCNGKWGLKVKPTPKLGAANNMGRTILKVARESLQANKRREKESNAVLSLLRCCCREQCRARSYWSYYGTTRSPSRCHQLMAFLAPDTATSISRAFLPHGRTLSPFLQPLPFTFASRVERLGWKKHPVVFFVALCLMHEFGQP